MQSSFGFELQGHNVPGFLQRILTGWGYLNLFYVLSRRRELIFYGEKVFPVFFMVRHFLEAARVACKSFSARGV